MFSRETRFLRPWVLGVMVWLALSLVVSREYLRTAEPRYLLELSGLLSLLWVQFGFAGMFHTLRKEKGRKVLALFLVTLVPPLMLFFLNIATAWWLGKSAYLPWP